jgi:hypothetical protein
VEVAVRVLILLVLVEQEEAEVALLAQDQVDLTVQQILAVEEADQMLILNLLVMEDLEL